MFAYETQAGAFMKKLYIVRHSKAVEYAPDGTDFSRCLADVGVTKARKIAQALSRDLPRVDLMLSSPACRARETADIFASALHYPLETIQEHDELYHFGTITRASTIISTISDTVETLMLFGHNPTFTALAWHLCSSFTGSMPTASVVGLEFKQDSWAEITEADGKLLTFLTRKSIQ